MAEGEKLIATHRKAHFNYEILEKFEAGIILQGSEVKAIREGRVNLADSYVSFKRNEAWLLNLQIQAYSHASPFNNHDPKRERKLLLHQHEIEFLDAQIQTKGLTLIPLRLYFKKGKAKIELGLARGKKLFDKRETLKKRETERDLQKVFKYKR